MKDEFELRIEKDGSIEGVYQDGLAASLDAEETRVCRASNVEWEESGSLKGWTVRSANDPTLVLAMDPEGKVHVTRGPPQGPVFFSHREEALKEEVAHFWELIACSHHKIVGCMICRYAEPPQCPVCGAGVNQDCDAGLHG